MFHKNIKLALAFLTIVWSVLEFWQGHIGNGIAILFLTGMFILLYFKNEFILLSFLQLRKQNFPASHKNKKATTITYTESCSLKQI